MCSAHNVQNLDFFHEIDEPNEAFGAKEVNATSNTISTPAVQSENASALPEHRSADEIRKSMHIRIHLLSKIDTSKERKRKHLPRQNKQTLKNVPLCSNFKTLKHSFSKGVLHTLEEKQFSSCTPVQSQCLPLLLQPYLTLNNGKGEKVQSADAAQAHTGNISTSLPKTYASPPCVLVCAPTGSGKTIAYLLPLITDLERRWPYGKRRIKRKGSSESVPQTTERKDHSRREIGLRSFVLVPTRELAIQVETELLSFSNRSSLRIMQCEMNKTQITQSDVIVSTPHRMQSFLDECGGTVLSAVQFCVVDEADRVLDKTSPNLLEQCSALLETLPTDHLSLSMFSATLPQHFDATVRRIMPRDFYRVVVGARVAPTELVDQKLIYVTNEQGKVDAIRRLLLNGFSPPMLVFTRSIERCEKVFREIGSERYRVAVLHSSLQGDARSRIMEQIRLGTVWILITTDLLARGIDIKNVGTILNFDFPPSPECYVHRVGRAGRAGCQGSAITLFTDADKPMVRDIAMLIQNSGSSVEPYLLEMKRAGRARRKLYRQSGF